MKRLAIVAAATIAIMTAATYSDEIAAWRKNREARLQAPGGWLSVAGLFWLHDGENTAVTDSVQSALPFCTGKSPAAETDSLLTAFG